MILLTVGASINLNGADAFRRFIGHPETKRVFSNTVSNTVSGITTVIAATAGVHWLLDNHLPKPKDSTPEEKK